MEADDSSWTMKAGDTVRTMEADDPGRTMEADDPGRYGHGKLEVLCGHNQRTAHVQYIDELFVMLLLGVDNALDGRFVGKKPFKRIVKLKMCLNNDIICLRITPWLLPQKIWWSTRKCWFLLTFT